MAAAVRSRQKEMKIEKTSRMNTDKTDFQTIRGFAEISGV
jgi:hypothetical protein